MEAWRTFKRDLVKSWINYWYTGNWLYTAIGVCVGYIVGKSF